MHGRFFALAGDGGGAGLVSINQFMSIYFHYQFIIFNQKMYWFPCLYINLNYFEKLILKFNVKKKSKLHFERVLLRSFPDNDATTVVHVSWWTTSKLAATRSFRFLGYSVFCKIHKSSRFNKSLDNGRYLTNVWFNEGGDHSWLIVQSLANRCLISHKRAEFDKKKKKETNKPLRFWQSEYYQST